MQKTPSLLYPQKWKSSHSFLQTFSLQCVGFGFPGGAVVKNPPANAGGTRDPGSIPGSGRSLGGVNVSPFQHSCLKKNPCSPEGYSPWGGKELDTTEQAHSCTCAHTHTHTHTHTHIEFTFLTQYLHHVPQLASFTF